MICYKCQEICLLTTDLSIRNIDLHESPHSQLGYSTVIYNSPMIQ